MSLYYQIWMDCIRRLQTQERNKNNWKLKSMIIMSVAMTSNFLLFMSIFERNIIHLYFYKIDVPFLSHYDNNVFNVIILFALPCVIVNYLLIFRANRYERLLNKYRYYNGKLILAYFTASLLLPAVLVCIAIFLAQYQ